MTVSVEAEAPRVGGSLIGAIFDCDSHGADQVSAYMALRGISNHEPTGRMSWGTRMEPLILDEYERVTGRKLIRGHGRIHHPVHPFMAASYDALCEFESRGVDAKLVQRDQRHNWGDTADDIPLQYQLQAHWYNHASNREYWDVAALIDFELKIYTIRRDPAIERELLTRVEAWWRKYIVGNEIPPVGAGESSRRWLRERFPANTKPLRKATDEEVELLETYAEIKACVKEANRDKDEIEAKLKLAVGDNDGMYWDRGKFTWKLTKDRKITDWEVIASSLLKAMPEAERTRCIADHSQTLPGYRRIYFRCDGLEEE